jgi:hypothetical protein
MVIAVLSAMSPSSLLLVGRLASDHFLKPLAQLTAKEIYIALSTRFVQQVVWKMRKTNSPVRPVPNGRSKAVLRVGSETTYGE